MDQLPQRPLAKPEGDGIATVTRFLGETQG
jgi:Trp operon repressor